MRATYNSYISPYVLSLAYAVLWHSIQYHPIQQQYVHNLLYAQYTYSILPLATTIATVRTQAKKMAQE
jgi:hypothetical protein